ncbi:MAG: ABC transporter permease, partial [Tabrizicola sp.]|uniref:ABC transporter permease n=1 Tax=Tabrizicola sp. TaxID=2005166 RepID=UPI003BB1AFF3
MIPTFVLVMIIIFVLVRLLPGDPALAIAGDRASDAELATIRERLGLNESMLMQFALFVKATLSGDMGRSILMRAPVASVIAEKLPITVFLAVYSVGLSLLIAGPLAFVAALNRGRWPDSLIRTIFQVGLSMPVFYIGLV